MQAKLLEGLSFSQLNIISALRYNRPQVFWLSALGSSEATTGVGSNSQIGFEGVLLIKKYEFL